MCYWSFSSLWDTNVTFDLWYIVLGLPWWLSGKESACNAGAAGVSGSIPGSGRSPGGGSSNPLQYSCLGNPMDRGAWWATVHGITRVGHDLVTIHHHPLPFTALPVKVVSQICSHCLYPYDY